jgi:hypothetical protein
VAESQQVLVAELLQASGPEVRRASLAADLWVMVELVHDRAQRPCCGKRQRRQMLRQSIWSPI